MYVYILSLFCLINYFDETFTCKFLVRYFSHMFHPFPPLTASIYPLGTILVVVPPLDPSFCGKKSVCDPFQCSCGMELNIQLYIQMDIHGQYIYYSFQLYFFLKLNELREIVFNKSDNKFTFTKERQFKCFTST